MEIITNWGRKLNGSLTELNLGKVDAIALHHMAHKTADIKTVQEWHLNNGWTTIGYNYWVGFDGRVYEGRGLNVGAGVLGQNSHIISIGFQGTYDTNQTMPDAQFNAGIDIISHVKSKVPTIKKVAGHGDFQATACPGTYFPLSEMLKLVKRGVTSSELTSVNDIIWEMGHRRIITDTDLWLKECENNPNVYWLIRKTVKYLMEKGV